MTSERHAGTPIRWLPRHGYPRSNGEWILQKAIQTIAFLPVYTALVVTLVLLVLVFGVPFLDGR